MGSRHAEVVSRNEQTQLWVAVDTDIAAARACAKRHACQSAHTLTCDVDIAIVATPSHAHFRTAQHALNHARWCLVEKPFLLPGQQLEHPRILVSHPERFHDALSGYAPRDLQTFQSTREGPPPSPVPYDDVFLDLLVHDLDLLCQWTTPISLLDAACSRTSSGSIEEGMAKYRLAGGGVATLHVSRVATHRRRTLKWTSCGQTTHVDLGSLPTKGSPIGTLDVQWDAVLQTIRGEEPKRKPATCSDGARVVALAAQARNHATQHAQG